MLQLKEIFSSKTRVKILISLLVSILALLPHVWAYWVTPKGYFFTGANLTTNLEDILGVYFAAIHNYSQGGFLYQNPFDWQPREIFHYPIYLLLGKIVAISGLSVPFVYHLAAFLFTFAFCLFIFKFLQFYFSDFRKQILAFGLSIFGGLFLLRVQEAVGIFVFSTPHLILSEFALFSTLYLLLSISLINNHSSRNYFLLIFSVLILSILHPWMIIPISVFWTLWCWYLFKNKKIKNPSPYFRVLLIMLFLSLPFLLYYKFKLPWVSLPLPSHKFLPLLVYGISFPTAFLGVFAVFKRRFDSRSKYIFLFLAFWFIIQSIFIYLPFSFQIRFIEGMFLPVAIFSVLAVDLLVQKLNFRFSINTIYLNVFLYLSIGVFANYLLLFSWLPNNYVYRRTEERQAAIFLEKESQSSERVLSLQISANAMSSLAHLNFFVGHVHQTADFQTKFKIAMDYYSGILGSSEREEFILREKICFVYLGPEEKGVANIDLNHESYLTEIFEAGDAKVYRTKWC